jgi:DNA mismatch repair protein MutL
MPPPGVFVREADSAPALYGAAPLQPALWPERPQPERPKRPQQESALPRIGACEYLGQIAGAYLVLREGDNLVLLDQHAAHERVLLNRLRKEAATGAGRALLLPLRLSLHPEEAERARALWDALARLGFSLRLEGDTLHVEALPVILERAGAEALLREVLAGKRDDFDSLRIAAACKGAVKAGDALTQDEAAGLAAQWMDLPDRDHCPHGRPCSLTWTPRDLERLFKRKP